MSIHSYLVVCLLAFHQFQLGQSRVLDTSEAVDEPLQVNKTWIPDRHRIIGGDLAKLSEIKYIVVTRHDDKYYMCGGGIIDDFYVLSAAHCFINDENKFDDSKITVVAGINNYKTAETLNSVEADVEKVYIPNNYEASDFPNDIALLKLKTSLNIEENKLEKLKLPTKALDLINQTALIAGFGYDKHAIVRNSKTLEQEEKFSSSGRLRKANILLFDNAECQKRYKKDKIYDSYLCGKMVKNSNGEYGVCNGDSGSPLVLDPKGSKTVVGVVSWSYGCDEQEVPMVYTRVSSFLDFIRNAKKDRTFGIKTKTFK